MTSAHTASTLATTASPAQAGQDRYADYDDWAWLYNQTVGPDYSEPQWRFLQRALLPGLPKQAELLDLCCGTGQLIQPLLKAGYRVTGLDGSEAMLDCAKQNAPGAHYLLADARHFDLPERFDGVFSTSASLNHIDSFDSLGQVFSRVHTALRPGGLFVFDLNHPTQLARWWRGRPTEGEIRSDVGWMITPRYDAGERRGAFTVTVHRAPAQGQRGPWRGLKNVVYRVLSKPRFIGLRLSLLQRLNRIEPAWRRQDIDYPVIGHDLGEVGYALRAAGFEAVRLETLDGGTTVDENHSAHFICRKALAA